MDTEVNGQKQSPPAGDESSTEPSAVPSESLAATISDLLAASEQAAQAIRERARVDIGALRRAAAQPDVAHSREQLPQLEASVSQLAGLVNELRAEVNQLRMEPTPLGEDRPPPVPPNAANGRPQLDRRALLIVLNMAGNGASRSETADYLAENLGLRDCDELLGAVYDYVASTRTGPR